jgi:TRAP-type transport system periplasmic protein
MITRRLALGAASGGVASVIFAPHISRAQSVKWRWGHAMPAAHSINVRANEAAERIRKDTNGAVDIQLFPDNQLGGDSDMAGQVRTGALQLYFPAATSIGPLVPAAGIVNIAFAFKDSAQGWEAMDGELGKHIAQAFAKVGLHNFEKGWENGFRQITTASKPVNSPADLAGVKMRVPTSPLMISIFKSLGSSPTSMNVAELYSALQTKIVDGQENPLSIIATRNFNEVQKYCALTNHVWDIFFLVANMNAWKAIPPDQQVIMVKHFSDAAIAQRKDVAQDNATLRKDLEAKGMVFNTPDSAPFREALAKSGFYAQWKKTYGEDAWGVLEKYVGKLG